MMLSFGMQVVHPAFPIVQNEIRDKIKGSDSASRARVRRVLRFANQFARN
jgi:hypothetical protein